MAEHLRHALELELGDPVTGLTRVGGGSINECYEVHVTSGARYFCKTHPRAPEDLFTVEAAGLAWLRDAEAIGVPAVVALRAADPALLVLEWIEVGHPHDGHPEIDEQLGRGIAVLHQSGAPQIGWDRDGYLGEVPQPNATRDDWPTFYREQRLAPLVRRAIDSGALHPEAAAGFDRLSSQLHDRLGPPEPPSRLHGDLWGGNLLVDRQRRPWLVDPAPYGGHREVDLAMMRLFGGFGRRVFESYDATFPLADGHEERVAIYQLYPLLVHALLFGGSYGHQVMQTLHRCL